MKSLFISNLSFQKASSIIEMVMYDFDYIWVSDLLIISILSLNKHIELLFYLVFKHLPCSPLPV